MGEFNLNLSTKPFPAYRALNLALAGVLVVLGAVSAWQAYGYSKYSKLAAELRGSERKVRDESDALGVRLNDLQSRLNRPEVAAKLGEIDFLNSLIQRKTFSWTRVFGDLEGLVPGTVHLIGMRPELDKKGQVWLHFEVQAKSVADVSRFIKALDDSPAFDSTEVSIEEKKTEGSKSTDLDYAMKVLYRSQKETPQKEGL
jgi:type IV pilus assembly protein PilN